MCKILEVTTDFLQDAEHVLPDKGRFPASNNQMPDIRRHVLQIVAQAIY